MLFEDIQQREYVAIKGGEGQQYMCKGERNLAMIIKALFNNKGPSLFLLCPRSTLSASPHILATAIIAQLCTGVKRDLIF